MNREDDPRREIELLFRDSGLPSEAALALTDPAGKHNYKSLAKFAEYATVEDLRDAGLQTADARALHARLQPGGDV